MRRILIAVGLLGAVILVLLFQTRGPSVSEGSVLLVELGGRYLEGPAPPLLSRLVSEPARPLASVLSSLAMAERDQRLAAVVFRIRDLDIGFAKAQELHQALLRLRERGRRPIAYLEVESFTGANLEYYVASAAEELYLAPGTDSPLLGLAAETLLFGGLLERLGVEVEVARIGRYKSAAEVFSRKEMSDAFREVTESLLDSFEGQLVSGIAAARGLGPDAVREAIDAAPVGAQGLLARKLADGERFLDEILDELGRERVVKEAVYAAQDPSAVGFEPVARVALVYGSGPVVTGSGRGRPGGDPVLAADTVAEALRTAAEDEDFDAILFRIDSPGGSALASDRVWRAVARAREAKPVVASFSDVAASGGYYVACGANAIVAEPTTLTGSIGVFVLRPVIAGLLDRLDIGYETFTRGRFAGLATSTRPLDEESSRRLAAQVAEVYATFVDRVAEGRGLDAAAVDRAGQGRVYTGEQALARGLVDELGGLRAAVGRIRTELGLAEDADVALFPHPPPPTLAEQIRQALSGVAVAGAGLPAEQVLPRALREWLAVVRAVPAGSPLALLPVALELR